MRLRASGKEQRSGQNQKLMCDNDRTRTQLELEKEEECSKICINIGL